MQSALPRRGLLGEARVRMEHPCFIKDIVRKKTQLLTPLAVSLWHHLTEVDSQSALCPQHSPVCDCPTPGAPAGLFKTEQFRL